MSRLSRKLQAVPPLGALYISEESTSYELVMFCRDAELSAQLIETHEKNNTRKNLWCAFIQAVHDLAVEYEKDYREDV